MKRHLLRICQFSFVVVAILSVVLLTVDGISVAVANGTPREAGHSKSGGDLLGKGKATFSSATARSDRLAKAYGSLPLSFEANEGQTDPSVQFVSHGSVYALFLEKDEAFLELQKPDETDALLQKMDPKTRKRFEARKFYHASPRFRRQRKAELVHVGIVGASPDAKIRALEELPGKSNYFVGNDPQKWHVGIPSYQRVEYEGIYPGVDLVYYGNQRQLEFDFVVAPHVDPSLINLHIQTNGRLRMAEDGSLRIETSAGSVVLHRPDIYQVKDNKRTPVNGRFALKPNGEVSFQIAAYDKTRSLIIDPALSYSTFLGGSASDFSSGIAVDSLGDAYIVGQATSTNFPTLNGYPSAANANGIAFVSELNPTGTALLYSTYLGGTGGEGGNAIALGPNASVCVTGYTFSTDFPVVNGFQTSLGTPNGNAFVSCLNTTRSGVGSLIYSTYLGGGGNNANSLGDTALGIAVDGSGFAYVTGQTASDASVTPFPTTNGSYQTSLASPNGNAFLSVVNTNQSGSASLAYSTYLGGASTGFGDYGMGVTVDSSRDAFITGETTSGGSTPFPITSNAYQTTLNSVNGNVFVTEISTTQSGAQTLVYSTYMGGSSAVSIGDSGSGIALDSSGKVYVDGDTTSSDFPVTAGAFQTSNSPGGRAFVAKFDLTQSGTQSLIYSTYLGGTNGSEGEVANGLAVDANGDAFASGSTSSSDFPTTSDAYQTSVKNDLWNVYLTQMNPTGTGLLYSTYLGGSCSTLYGDLGFGVAIDSLGNAYIDGSTCSTDFPVYPSNAYQAALGGTYNAFIAKFAVPTALTSIAVNPQSVSIGLGTSEEFTATGTYSNGNTANLTASVVWSTSDSSIAEVSNVVGSQGSATSQGTGTAAVIATFGPLMGSTTLSVVPEVMPSAPVLSSISPTSGSGGTAVTITGSGFGATQGSSVVNFSGGTATVTSWSATSIAVTAPTGAITGPVTVTVGGVPSNPVTFTVGSPALQIASPVSGSVVNQGQSIPVSVTSPANLTFTNVAVLVGDPLVLPNPQSSVPASFSISVPSSTASGNYSLIAFGVTAGQVIQSAPVTVDVERPDMPTSVVANPSSFIFDSPGQSSPISVGATFSDGTSLDVTKSSNIVYSSSNPAAATVSATGVITAVGSGSTFIGATYSEGGQWVQAFTQVTVSSSPLSVSPSVLTFGSQNIGTSSSVQTITVTNLSSVPINILGISVLGDFSETDNCVSSSPLTAYNSCTINIAFAPNIAGPDNGAITIKTSVDGVPTVVSLSGTGVTP